jgi:hypothetical protein
MRAMAMLPRHCPAPDTYKTTLDVLRLAYFDEFYGCTIVHSIAW